jgi:hypothetical protein
MRYELHFRHYMIVKLQNIDILMFNNILKSFYKTVLRDCVIDNQIHDPLLCAKFNV